MVESNTQSREGLYWLKIVIGLAFMFGFGFLPGFSTLTPVGMQVLGIFIGLCWLWTTADLVWPSVLGLTALALSDYGTMGKVLASSFGNDTVVMMIFITAIVAVLDSAGLNNFIANWFLQRKLMTRGPWLFTLVWFFSVWFLAAFSNAFVAILLFWSLFYTLAGRLGIALDSKYAVSMLAGTGMIASLVLAFWPFKSLALILLGTFQNITHMEINMLLYMLVMFLMTVAVIVLYTAAMRFIIRVDVSPLSKLNADNLAMTDQVPLTKRQKFLLGFLAIFILLMIVPSLIPKTWLLGQLLSKIGSSGMVMLLFAFLAVWKVEGEALLQFQVVKNQITWDLVFLVAAAMAISTAMTAEETGIKPFMSAILDPIFSGAGATMFIILICFVALILTNVANNAVIGLLLINVIVVYASQFAVNMPGAVVLMIFCSAIAFVFPSSSVMGAIIYGNPYLKSRTILQYALLMVLIAFIVVCLVGIPLVNWLF